MLNQLNKRRTIRKYSNKAIAPDLLNRLLETACRASNTGNMQTYSIVVTSDKETKKRLSPVHFNQTMVNDAPVILTFCADFNRFTKWCKQRNANPGFENFQSFIGSAIDALLVAQTFAIAAESEGLGICYLGTTTYNADKIIEILELPKLVVPIASITLGYPNENPELTDRLALSGIVHKDHYKDYSAEDIDRLYTPKEESEFYQKFIAEHNKETLPQVFTDIRYTKENSEFFSVKFLEVLKNQGFFS